MKRVIIACLLTLWVSVGASVGVSSLLDDSDTSAEQGATAWSASECSEARSTLGMMQELCAGLGPVRGVDSSSVCLGIADLQIAINDNCPFP